MIPLLLFNLLVPGIQTWVLVQGMPELGVGDLLNYGLSIGSFYWLITNVALASKVPWGQRVFPYDGRVRAHVWASVGLLVGVTYHAVYKLISETSIDLWAWMLLGTFAVLAIGAVLWVPVPGGGWLRNLLRTRISGLSKASYDLNKAVHRVLVWVLVLLVPLHVADGSLFTLIPAWSVAGYLVPWALALGLYILSHTPLVVRKAVITRLEVVGSRVELGLRPPRHWKYLPGQFAYVDGHPFSLVSIPSDPELGFVARIQGPFTRALAVRRVGDTVRLNGGYGAFGPRDEQPTCFVAAGVGVIPVVSILRDLRTRGDRRELVVFLSLSRGESIPGGWLAEEALHWPGLRLHIVDGKTPNQRFSGEFFRRELEHPLDFRYYVCASIRVRDAILQGLHALGVPPSRILYEEFALGVLSPKSRS